MQNNSRQIAERINSKIDDGDTDGAGAELGKLRTLDQTVFNDVVDKLADMRLGKSDHLVVEKEGGNVKTIKLNNWEWYAPWNTKLFDENDYKGVKAIPNGVNGLNRVLRSAGADDPRRP